MNTIGREFMEMTTYRYLGESDQQKGLAQPALEMPYDPETPLIDLPSPAEIDVGNINLRNAIEERRSVRRYDKQSLNLEELAFLLWCTQGVQTENPNATFRTVPSAGARHALETFLLVNRVADLKPGLYRYLALSHTLAQMKSDKKVRDLILAGCLGQGFVKTSAVTFAWAADIKRMAWRYGERGYRYIHLDAGHVCQNLYLAAAAVDCGACAIAAFDDALMNSTLGLDGIRQFTVYIAAVGKKA